MDFIIRLQHTGVMDWFRESGSLVGYPAVLFLHTLGLGAVAGMSAVINLRLLGVAPKIPLAPLTRFFPIIWAAFWVTAFSGTILLIADAEQKLRTPIFWVKITFIILALVNLRLLRRRVFADPQLDEQPLSTQARLLAATSLIFWIGATTAGRLMAYIGPVAGLSS
jgi:hypothetical protein